MFFDLDGLYTVRECDFRLKGDYEDSAFTRMKDGIELPQVSAETHLRLNHTSDTSAWGAVRLDKTRCFYRTQHGQILMTSIIKKHLGSSATPHQLLATHLMIPNGQVKNFLNACRACNGIDPVETEDTIRVLVAGSKSIEGGGLWHKYFALYLAQMFKHVFIDFMDYAESADFWELTTDSCDIHCHWVVGGVVLDAIPEKAYHVLVDDCWLVSTGPGLPGVPSVFCGYSLKGNTNIQKGYRPYLHSTETRFFSHPGSMYKPPCSCLLCREIGEVSEDYEDYTMLRSICARLGHRSYCCGVDYSDQNSVSSLVRMMTQLPANEIHKSKILRIMTAVSEEFDIVVHGISLTIGNKPPKFRPYTRFQVDSFIAEKYTYPFLEGKNVGFSGVKPSILLDTIISPLDLKHSTYVYPVQGDEVVFVNSSETWANYSNFNRIYAPLSPNMAAVLFPGWSRGSYSVEQYLEYYKIEVPIIPLLVVAQPYFKIRNEKHLSIEIYPYVSSEVNFHPKLFSASLSEEELEKSDCVSYIMKDFEMVLIPFDKAKWRSSLFIFGNVASWHTGELLGTDLYRGLPYDFTLEEAKKAHWWPDIQSWVESPDFAVISSDLSQSFLLKKDKWEIIKDNQKRFIFSHKLPRSFLIHKIYISLIDWESFVWSLDNFRNLQRLIDKKIKMINGSQPAKKKKVYKSKIKRKK